LNELLQKYLKILVLLLCSIGAQAQRPIILSVNWPQTKEGNYAKKNIAHASFFTDSIALSVELNSILIKCNELSFLQAEFSNFVYKADSTRDSITASLNLGQSYKWAKLRKGNVPQDILGGAGFREEQFVNKQFNPEQFSRRVERILGYLENNGYPFASIKLDSVEADSIGISAALNLTFNELILFDTIELIGNANVKKWYLYKYLGIKPNSIYSEDGIRQINSRISQLPFLRTTHTPAVYFYGNKAMPIIYLETKKASSIDGIIGFAPNSNTTGSDKLLITGEANLQLQNLFGTGKSFDLNYRSFLGNSQDLKLKFVYPYIFRTNLALDYSLGLLKQDTTYLDVNNEFGLQYRFIGNDYFKVFYNIQRTSLITVDTNQIKATRSLPEASDIVNNTYGLGFKMSRFDYFINPRKGFGIDVNAGVGVKEIIRNPTIEALQFSDGKGGTQSLYDTIPVKFVQYKVKGMAELFIPIFTRASIRTQAFGGHIVAENLFINELFRIGGIRTLKGFDEQAIFASTYVIGNIELRYLLQQNSNVLLFWNGAYYRNTVRNPVLSDTPYGFGAGLNMETGAGVFSLFYAVGKEFNNPINLSRAKVHFGFVNYF
jgi:translocation and assembly module TamA